MLAAMGRFNCNDPPALAIAAEIGDKVRPIFERSVIPILGVNEAAVSQHGKILIVGGGTTVLQYGTGTLLQVGDDHFLVTAAHVFDELDKAGRTPSIWAGDPLELTPLVGQCYRTDEIADLAVMRIDDREVNELPKPAFLGLSAIELRPKLPDGWYFLYGFPSVLTHRSTDSVTVYQEAFTYRTGLYHGTTSGFRNYNADYHVLVELGSDARNADDGSPTLIPRLGGISGSSIWLGFSEKHIYGDWGPNDAKIVGVQTKVYPDKNVVQGTRWFAVACILWVNFPHLRGEIAAHLPKSLHRRLANSQ
jgi:hypothetical protein